MKKSVLIVIESLNCGGGEKSLVSHLSELDYDRFDVDLLIHNKNGGLFESLVDEHVKILPKLPFVDFCEKGLKSNLLSFNFKYLIPKIKWALAIRNKKNKSRHACEPYWECCAPAFKMMEKEYDVAIAWGQGNSTHYVAEKVNAKRKYAWINADYIQGNHDRDYDLPFYEKYNRIVVVSDKLLPITQKVFPEFADDMTVVYDLLNANMMEKMSKLENPFENNSKLKLVTVGRMEKPKGYNLVIDACVELKKAGVDFAWYIVGDGIERPSIETGIRKNNLEKNLIILGIQANPYIYIGNADIYVQTSIFEGYCITLAEARILNKPIVSTNFDVVYDQIINEENGLIVEKNGKSIADGIIRLANDKNLQHRFINNLKKEKKGNIEETDVFMNLLDE